MDTWQERIARTGFFTGAISYVSFWIVDAIRPGFVARYLSVHLFLLAAIAFGAWWTLAARSYRDWPFAQYVVAAAFGIVLATIAWNFGAGFESYRLLAVLAAFVAPLAVLATVRA